MSQFSLLFEKGEMIVPYCSGRIKQMPRTWQTPLVPSQTLLRVPGLFLSLVARLSFL